MRLTCRRVPAGDAAEEQGRHRGALPAAGAQRAASRSDRHPGREGDPQLRAGRQGGPGGAGPAGVVDLAVPGPGRARSAAAAGGARWRCSTPAGWAGPGCWTGCGSGWGSATAIRRVAAGRRLDAEAAERVIFALVAQRALEPGSKLAATGGSPSGCASRAAPGSTTTPPTRAMDFLLDALDEIAAEIFSSVAHLLNLDVDIVFVDTTTTYWEIDGRRRAGRARPRPGVTTTTAQPQRGRDAGVRALQGPPRRPAAGGDRDGGHPRRDPGPRAGPSPATPPTPAIIRTVKDDLAGWNLRRLVWVADRGFASAANRGYLTRGGGHYIHAEKLRHTNAEAAAALARQGRYQHRRRQPAGQGGPGRPGGDGDGDAGPGQSGSSSATTPSRPSGTAGPRAT